MIEIITVQKQGRVAAHQMTHGTINENYLGIFWANAHTL